MVKTETYGEIKDGKLKIFHQKEFLNAIRLLPDCRIKLIVEKTYHKRSNSQNAYYWSVVISDFVYGFKETTGEEITPNEAHELLKQNLNYKEITNKLTGEVIKVGMTTTKITTMEMEDYLDKCRKFILEYFGIVTLLPNEQASIMFNE